MPEKILRTEYSEEMQRSYMNYSMSVITARAIPDARDGLKPVQRRVLYDMAQLHLDYDKPHRKCARIVGDTMGKYHPHGDSSIYDTLVVLSQDFKKGRVLVDGHGNFGSIEGDGAAAMRYTEARLEKFTQEVYLKDLDKTVRFVPNYDETEEEPEVLPVRVPNLLVNGAEGIAVGMSTSIPTHNLGEVIDAVNAYIDNREISTQELLAYLPGPDFPTGGIIANKSDLPSIYETGTGKIRLRGKIEVELGKRRSDKDKLVITQIPYTMIGTGINKFLSDVAELVETKKLTDVTDISNQSSKEGIRIVLELKRDADIERIKNILYKKTRLEDTFGVNMLAIAGGRPETLSLKGILGNFLDFQYENTERKYRAMLLKEEEKKEVQEGLIRACDCIDLIIAVLRGAKNLKDAKDCLMKGDTSKIHFRNPQDEADARGLNFTQRQADAILQMRLYKLIGLELLALKKEHKETLEKIKAYKKILSSRDEMNRVIKEDLSAIKKEFAIPRRTLIEDGPEAVYTEEVKKEQEAVFVLDRFGYCKLLDKGIYEKNSESINGTGVRALACLTSDRLCLFSEKGSLVRFKVEDVPFCKVKDKGTPIENVSKYDGKNDRICLLVPERVLTGKTLIFVTKQGMIKRVGAEEFETNNRLVSATKLKEGDGLCTVVICGDETEIVLSTSKDAFLRFKLEEIPLLKKASQGVRGIRLSEGEEVTGLFLIGKDPVLTFKGRQVHLNRLKLSKRDAKGIPMKT